MGPRRLTFAVSASLLTASLGTGCPKPPLVNTGPEPVSEEPTVNPADPGEEPGDVEAPEDEAAEGDEAPEQPEGPIVNTRPGSP